MSRFSTPEEAMQAATVAAQEDYKYYKLHGKDLNPFSTQGARYDWQRGFEGRPAMSYEHPDVIKYDTIYLRGRAAALIMEAEDAKEDS